MTGATDYLTAKSLPEDRVLNPFLSAPTELNHSLPPVSKPVDDVASNADKPLDRSLHMDSTANDVAANGSATDQRVSDSSAMDIDPKPDPVKMSEGIPTTITG